MSIPRDRTITGRSSTLRHRATDQPGSDHTRRQALTMRGPPCSPTPPPTPLVAADPAWNHPTTSRRTHVLSDTGRPPPIFQRGARAARKRLDQGQGCRCNGLVDQITPRHRATPAPFESTTYGSKIRALIFRLRSQRVVASISSRFIRTPHLDFTATHHGTPPHHGRPARPTLARRTRSGSHCGEAFQSDSQRLRRQSQDRSM